MAGQGEARLGPARQGWAGQGERAFFGTPFLFVYIVAVW